MFFSREVSSKTRSTSSIWSPRSDHRAQSVISTPARGPEMARAPRALVASPVISGISTTGGVPSQRAQSQSSPHVVQPRQTRSFTPPGVVVPAWAWLPSAIAKVQNPVLKALPTPNRSRSLQRPPLRVIQVSQVTRSSLKTNVTNVGQSLRVSESQSLWIEIKEVECARCMYPFKYPFVAFEGLACSIHFHSQPRPSLESHAVGSHAYCLACAAGEVE